MASGEGPDAPGYSGKPLVKKLGLKPDMAAIAIAPPPNYIAIMDNNPAPWTDLAPAAGQFEFIHLFVRTAHDLESNLPPTEARLAEGGMLWVSWPKKSSPLFRNLTEDGVRAVALPMGLVDIKVCAVDADWSGLKLVRRKAG